MTIERGYDPRDFSLFANGGEGPSHDWVLSAELGLDSFIVPAAATAVSAFGTGNSDLGFTIEQPCFARIRPGAVPNAEQLTKIDIALQLTVAEVRKNLEIAAARGNVRVERYVSIRFRGQTHFLDIVVERERFDLDGFKQVVARFEAEYETLFGRGAAFSKAGYEILAARSVGSGALPPPAQATKGEPLTYVRSRPVVFTNANAPVETKIYETSFPQSGAQVEGPCIIEFPGQSVVVPPGYGARADDFGNLHVKRN